MRNLMISQPWYIRLARAWRRARNAPMAVPKQRWPEDRPLNVWAIGAVICALGVGAGMLIERYVTERKVAAKSDDPKPAKNAPTVTWSCAEIQWMCATRERMSKVKKKDA